MSMHLATVGRKNSPLRGRNILQNQGRGTHLLLPVGGEGERDGTKDVLWN